MKRSIGAVRLALICCGLVLAGCAPQLVGMPDQTGLVVFEGEIEREGILGISSTNFANSAVLHGPNSPITGNPFKQYVVFSNLAPGSYELRQLSYSYVANNRKYTYWVKLNNDIHQRYPALKFAVEPGKTVYVGKLKVFSKQNFSEKDLRFDMEDAQTLEQAAWKAMLLQYKSTPWAKPMEARLKAIGG